MQGNKKSPMQEMMGHFPQNGIVTWIGTRPERRGAMISKSTVSVSTESGLAGDHFSGRAQGKRQITFIQNEHLAVIASMVDMLSVNPELLRRNVVISGVNLVSLKNQQFKIGSAIFEMTGLCHPCSRMEENLGHGGYNAVRGHGGITAKVIESGEFRVGDRVQILINK